MAILLDTPASYTLSTEYKVHLRSYTTHNNRTTTCTLRYVLLQHKKYTIYYVMPCVGLLQFLPDTDQQFTERQMFDHVQQNVDPRPWNTFGN